MHRYIHHESDRMMRCLGGAICGICPRHAAETLKPAAELANWSGRWSWSALRARMPWCAHKPGHRRSRYQGLLKPTCRG